MKLKYIFSLMMLAFAFTSCEEPLKDITDELDKNADDEKVVDLYKLTRVEAPAAYTLTDEDYALSSDYSVSNYKNFSASSPVKDFMPEILNQLFYAEDAADLEVTFTYYEKVVADESGAYELSDEDYTLMGMEYPNFSSEGDEAEFKIEKLLNATHYASSEEDKTVKYLVRKTKLYRFVKVNADGSTEEVEEDANAYKLIADDYDLLGTSYGQPGNYNNFDDIEQALDLADDLAGLRGDVLPVVYECYIYENFYNFFTVYHFDGTSWMIKESTNLITEKLSFALDATDVSKSTWWADPAIKIELVYEDYDAIPETADYNNFDLREGKMPGTDRAKFIELVGAILDAQYTIVEDQQYLVSYKYYDGNSGYGSVRVVKTGGVWSEATI